MSKKLTDDAQLQKEAEKLYPFEGRNPNVTLINGRREGYIEGRKHSVAPVLSEEQIKEEADKAMNYLITECASSERTALINMMRDMRDDYLENLTANSKQHTEK